MLESLDIIFIEDKTKFNGASREELRAHFQEWVADSFAGENPQADQKLLFDDEPVPRYRYFFEMDEDALRSCGGDAHEGHANFVDGFWSSSGHCNDTEVASGKPQAQAKAIPGSSDICWMRMDKAFFMDPHFYAGMSGSVDTMWRFLYETPPTIVPTQKLVTMIQIQNMSRRK